MIYLNLNHSGFWHLRVRWYLGIEVHLSIQNLKSSFLQLYVFLKIKYFRQLQDLTKYFPNLLHMNQI